MHFTMPRCHDATMIPDRQAGSRQQPCCQWPCRLEQARLRASESIGSSLLGVGGWRLGASVCCANCGCAVPRKDSLEGRRARLMTRGRRVSMFHSAAWVRVCWSRVGLMQSKDAMQSASPDRRALVGEMHHCRYHVHDIEI